MKLMNFLVVIVLSIMIIMAVCNFELILTNSEMIIRKLLLLFVVILIFFKIKIYERTNTEV